MEEIPSELQTALDDVVRRRGKVAPEELRALVNRFLAACKAAHAKLDECYRLASSGLRSEAIFLADSPPALLQFIEVIESPAAQEFRAMMIEAELAPPPATNMDRLAAIESAHAALNQLEPLQSEYSRLIFPAHRHAPRSGSFASSSCRQIQQSLAGRSRRAGSQAIS